MLQGSSEMTKITEELKKVAEELQL
jgi:hypothetical protein